MGANSYVSYSIGGYAEKFEPATGDKSLEDLRMLNTADDRMIDEAAKLMSMITSAIASFSVVPSCRLQIKNINNCINSVSKIY